MRYTSKDLVEMLSYPRPARSQMEEAFITKYIKSVPGIKQDKFGNLYKKIATSDVCFACHTDTVHHSQQNKRQQVHVSNDGWAFKQDNDVLGADDTTGVWICLNLMSKKVPGLYIFHRDEEIGGQGSSFILRNHPQLLKGITKVVSLDRKDYHDVVIWQKGRLTASEEFGQALAQQLGHNFKTAKGVFTDSANYTSIVPECCNLSVGYFYAHSADEIQDLTFAEALLSWLSNINWKALPIKRVTTTPSTTQQPKKQWVDDYWGYQDLNTFWTKDERR